MTLDANIVIAYLDGDPHVIETLSRWKEEGRSLIVATVAEAEVLSFSGWTTEECEDATRFLEEHFTSLPFDRAVARIAAEIRRKTKIKFPDAAIAATALFSHTPLVTRNVRDFKKVPSLEILSL